MRIIALSFFLTTFLASVGRGQAPFWPFPDFPVRLALHIPSSPLPPSSWIIPVHHGDLPFTPSSFRLTPADSRTPLPLWPIIQTPHHTFLVTTTDATSQSPKIFFLYLSPSNIPSASSQPTPPSPAPPILVSLHPSRGRCFPENWQEILFFLQNRPGPFRVFSLANLPAQITRDKRSGILVLETYLTLPQTGPYRIRAVGSPPLIGALDSNPLDEKTLEGTVNGPALIQIRLFNGMADPPVTLGLEWQPPGTADFVPIPPEALVAWAMASPFRLEYLSRTLQPAFSVERFRPYGFYRHSPLFFPVRFTDESVNWLPHPYIREWRFPDGSLSQDPAPSFVFLSPGPHTVTLRVEDALGFKAEVFHSVIWTDTIPLFYTFSATPAPLPAAAFRADWLEPTLLTRGQWPETLSLDMESVLFTLSAPPVAQTFSLQPSSFDKPVPLARCRAGDFDRIEWSVRHQGALITNGIIRALHPPIPPHHPCVIADRLLNEKGEQIVYVVPRLPPPLPPVSLPPSFPILLLDDFLVHPAFPEASSSLPLFLTERIRQEIYYVSLPDQRTLSTAWTPLLKFEHIPSLAGSPPARLVLAIAGQDLENGLPPDQFERQVAALSDRLLSDGFALIWVTPPPFPERVEKARAYAIALRRIAESRRIPVADLFTLFSGSENQGAPLFSDLYPMALTARGRRLAADAIAERIESLPSPATSPP